MESSDTTLQQLMFSLIEVWRGSGKTQREFCKEKDIAYSKFQYWMKKYSDKDLATGSSPGFLPINLKKQDERRASAMEVIYPDGRRLIFHQDVDPSFLRTLLS